MKQVDSSSRRRCLPVSRALEHEQHPPWFESGKTKVLSDEQTEVVDNSAYKMCKKVTQEALCHEHVGFLWLLIVHLVRENILLLQHSQIM